MTLKSFYTKLQKISLTFRSGLVQFKSKQDVYRLQLYWPYANYASYKGDFYASAKTVIRICRRPLDGFWCAAFAILGFGVGIECLLPAKKWKIAFNILERGYDTSPFEREIEAPDEKTAQQKALIRAKEEARAHGVPYGEEKIGNLKVEPLEQWKIEWDKKQQATTSS